jgi:CTP:molybdopterin cytidylyltransferase MocA
VLVVLGAGAEEIQAQCQLGSARTVWNPEWREGLGSSVRAGVSVLQDEVDALILMTCDQPAVSPDHLRRLIAAASLGEARIASSYGGSKGVPALFAVTKFGELLELRGDRGAREILSQSLSVDLPDGELDVDSPEALERARARYDR